MKTRRAAYAPLMQQLSDQGIMAVVVPMPLDLAIFGVSNANDVIAAYPEIKHWIIGGHSLGGSMAAEFVKGQPSAVKGIAFMAAYPADFTNLSALPIKVVSIHGSNDGLATDATVPLQHAGLAARAVSTTSIIANCTESALRAAVANGG